MAEDARSATTSCVQRPVVAAAACYDRVIMARPDLNLLVTLDVLLQEGSVVNAARRLRLSPSAMSRALARLRATTGDPLLVRAGGRLVPTPRALDLRQRVGALVEDAEALLRPQAPLAPEHLERQFTLRASDGFVETFGATLVSQLQVEAPGVILCFVPKPDRDSAPLRDGAVDLETGVVGRMTGPEVRARVLFKDRFVGVVRQGHPLAEGAVTAARYADHPHVAVVRHGATPGPIDGLLDDAMTALRLHRRIVAKVGGFSTALALVRGSDLVATVPERHTAGLSAGLNRFALPVTTPEIAVSLLWHPRMDGDPAHGWLRQRVWTICRAVAAQTATAPSGGS